MYPRFRRAWEPRSSGREMHQIRFATTNDQHSLSDFIDEVWKTGHVLARDDRLFSWQHRSGSRLNFAIAVAPEIGRIDAISGFIPCAQFDEELAPNRDFWMVMWKRRESADDPMLGLRLHHFLQEQLKPTTCGAIGLTPVAARLYGALGFEVGKVNQYFIARDDCHDFRLIEIHGFAFAEHQTRSRQSLVRRRIEDITSFPTQAHRPFKSLAFLRNRYANHPTYDYTFYQLSETGTIFVVRKCEANGASCLRIIDIIGDVSQDGATQREWQCIMNQEQAEYVDCLNSGVPASCFRDLGFYLRNDQITIPHYYEPFERRNVDICCAFKNDSDTPYAFFKGDADQDRPNYLGARE